MLAVKANKAYQVDEVSKETYLKQGYDIVDEKGKVIERSHQATVSYAEYSRIKAENDTLKEEIENLKAKKKAGN